MKLLTLIIRRSPRAVILGIVAGAIGGATSAGLFALINNALTGEPGTREAWLFAGLCLAVPVTRIVSSYLLVRLGQRAVFDLRLNLARQILAAPLRSIEQHGAHRFLVALTDDIGSIGLAVFELPNLCLHLTLLIGCLVYLGWLSPVVLVYLAVAMVLGYLSYRLPFLAGRRRFASVRRIADKLQKRYREVTDGIKELKIHEGRRQAFFSGLRKSASSFERHNVASTTIFSAANAWGQLLFFVVIGLLLFVLPTFQDLERKTLVGYTLVLLYMLTPIQVLLGELPNIGRANVALSQLQKLGISILDTRLGAEMEGEPRPAPEWKSIELKGVTHSYYREDQASTFVLGPVDFELKPGELVFLIGGNGSGKTTLAKLLLGLYTPEEGEIRLDGQPVTDGDQLAYQRLFTAVFSDFYLFDSLLGLDHPELDSQARGYLQKLQLDRKVEVEDGELSTVQLSQGQRKRLALLTAYLEDRSIYVFDEWAADQDPYFKEIFYHQLLPELRSRDKTVIVISHDDKYYDVADRIVKLDYGQVEFDRRREEARVELS